VRLSGTEDRRKALAGRMVAVSESDAAVFRLSDLEKAAEASAAMGLATASVVPLLNWMRSIDGALVAPSWAATSTEAAHDATSRKLAARNCRTQAGPLPNRDGGAAKKNCSETPHLAAAVQSILGTTGTNTAPDTPAPADPPPDRSAAILNTSKTPHPTETKPKHPTQE